jgi:MoxR-like ATPase
VVDLDDITRLRKSVAQVYLDEKIESYILDLVFATRNPQDYKLAELQPLLSFGASPRATINLARAAKAQAFLQRRGYVVPEDIRAVAKEVLRHRLGLTYEAEAENISADDLVTRLIDKVEVP